MNSENVETNINIPFHLNAYWEEFYISSDLITFSEWYFDLHTYSSNKFNIKNWDKDSEIIILGVGNTYFIDFLVQNKFLHVTLVDFSSTLIEYLKNKYENLEECQEWDCKF